MQSDIDIKHLSISEKLRMMEVIWEDLSSGRPFHEKQGGGSSGCCL